MWNKKMECMDREELAALQLQRLKDTVEHVYHNVPFYRERLDRVGMTPDKFKTLRDLEEIPYTTKDDIRDHYPFGLFAVPMREIVRVHASSGTTGKPTVVGYTKEDLDMWSECMARLITMGGATADDVAQIAFGYGLFTGAFGLHYGLEKVGATVVPTSSGNTEKQVMLMQDFGTTVLIATPSYAMYISEVIQDMGIKKENLKLKYALLGAEGSTEEMRQELEQRLGIIATENYGLSEIMGPGVAGECLEKCGMHICEDCFYTEIIDSQSGQVKPWNELGEVVITPLLKKGFPLLRYRTKDLSYVMEEPCKCGRTSARLAKIQGRADDMLIIKGVNVFPSQIESVLVGMEHIGPYYQLTVTKNGYFDELEVAVELTDASILDSYGELERLTRQVKHKIHTVLGLDVKLKLVEPKSLQRFTGKAKRVIDLR